MNLSKSVSTLILLSLLLTPSSAALAEGIPKAKHVAQAKQLVQAGMKLEARGKISAAESKYIAAMSTDPKNADAFFDLGVLNEKRGDSTAALAMYKRASELEPNNKQLAEAVETLQMHLAMTNDVQTPLQPSVTPQATPDNVSSSDSEPAAAKRTAAKKRAKTQVAAHPTWNSIEKKAYNVAVAGASLAGIIVPLVLGRGLPAGGTSCAPAAAPASDACQQ